MCAHVGGRLGLGSAPLGQGRAADLVERPLQLESVQGGQRQAQKDLDAVLERPERLAEGHDPGHHVALDLRRVGDAPVGGHGLARPDRADLGGRPVAHGKDEVHRRGTGGGEFRPVLAAQAVGQVVVAPEYLQGQGMHGALGVAPCAVAGEASAPQAVDDALAEDAAGGIAGAEEENVIGLVGHRGLLVGG